MLDLNLRINYLLDFIFCSFQRKKNRRYYTFHYFIMEFFIFRTISVEWGLENCVLKSRRKTIGKINGKTDLHGKNVGEMTLKISQYYNID